MRARARMYPRGPGKFPGVIARVLEALAAVGVPAALLLVHAARAPRVWLRLTSAALVLVAAGALSWLAASREPRRAPRPPSDGPLVAPGAGYTGSSACKRCHPGEYATWHASYHRTMTQAPSSGTVEGDFSGMSIGLNGALHRLERDGDAFAYVDPSGARHRIVLLTGSHRMQAYWYPMGRTRTLAQVPFMWLREEACWVPRNAAFLRPPSVVGHPPSEDGRWNSTCLRCHTTNPLALVNTPEESDTCVAELGIACEACHGPGEAHARANEDPRRRYALHVTGRGDATIVNPARLAPARSTEVCGQCHSVSTEATRDAWDRWNNEGAAYRPGDVLAATRTIVRYRSEPGDDLTRRIFALNPTFMEDRFWRDGMLRVTGREMSALLETPCATRGNLTCLTCHSEHQTSDDPRDPREWADRQLRPAAQGDTVCAGCHAEIARSGTAHTHHAVGSPGSQCTDCHMPRTTYGLQRAIMSHRIGRPSAQESHAVGRPNACNLCHLDRTLAWTEDRIAEWFGAPRSPLTDDERTVAAGHLWLLSGDAGQRALAAASAGSPATRAAAGDFDADLAELLDDPYESVRLIAWRSLRRDARLSGISYFFLGSRDARLRARDAVLERAGARGLDPPTLERLRAKRDDRRVDLSE